MYLDGINPDSFFIKKSFPKSFPLVYSIYGNARQKLPVFFVNINDWMPIEGDKYFKNLGQFLLLPIIFHSKSLSIVVTRGKCELMLKF